MPLDFQPSGFHVPNGHQKPAQPWACIYIMLSAPSTPLQHTSVCLYRMTRHACFLVLQKSEVKNAAEGAAKAMVSIINPNAVPTVLAILFEGERSDGACILEWSSISNSRIISQHHNVKQAAARRLTARFAWDWVQDPAQPLGVCPSCKLFPGARIQLSQLHRHWHFQRMAHTLVHGGGYGSRHMQARRC